MSKGFEFDYGAQKPPGAQIRDVFRHFVPFAQTVEEEEGFNLDNDQHVLLFRDLAEKRDRDSSAKTWSYKYPSNIRKALSFYEAIGLAHQNGGEWKVTEAGRAYADAPPGRRNLVLLHTLYHHKFSAKNQEQKPVIRTALTVLNKLSDQHKSMDLNDLARSVLRHPDDPESALHAYEQDETVTDVQRSEAGKLASILGLIKQIQFFNGKNPNIALPPFAEGEFDSLVSSLEQKRATFVEQCAHPSADELEQNARDKRSWLTSRLQDKLDMDEVEARKRAREAAPELMKGRDDFKQMSPEARSSHRQLLEDTFAEPYQAVQSVANSQLEQQAQNLHTFRTMMEQYYRQGQAHDYFERQQKNREQYDELQDKTGKRYVQLEELAWKLIDGLDGGESINPNSYVRANGHLGDAADGGQGDIEGVVDGTALVVEPTLIDDRMQFNREATSVINHLQTCERLDQDNTQFGPGNKAFGDVVGLYLSGVGGDTRVSDDDFVQGYEKETLKLLHSKAAEGDVACIPITATDFDRLMARSIKEGKTKKQIVTDLKAIGELASECTYDKWVDVIRGYVNDLSVDSPTYDMQQKAGELTRELRERQIPVQDSEPWIPYDSTGNQPDGLKFYLPDGVVIRMRVKNNGRYVEGDISSGNQRIARYSENVEQHDSIAGVIDFVLRHEQCSEQVKEA